MGERIFVPGRREADISIPVKTIRVRDGERVEGRRLAFATYGPADGKPTFLLQGSPSGLLVPSLFEPGDFQMMLKLLNRKLIVPERPGYGLSDKKYEQTVADDAHDVRAIANELGIDKFSVVGRSGGGPRAFASAALMPDRVTGMVTLGSLSPELFQEGLAEPNKSFSDPSSFDRIARKFNLVSKIHEDPGYLLDVHLREGLTAFDREVTNDPIFRRQFEASHKEASSAGPWGWIDDDIAKETDWEVDWEKINKSIPVLIWHGREDTFVRFGNANLLHELVPTSQLIIEPHKAHFNAFAQFPKALAWLNKNEGV